MSALADAAAVTVAAHVDGELGGVAVAGEAVAPEGGAARVADHLAVVVRDQRRVARRLPAGQRRRPALRVVGSSRHATVVVAMSAL